MNIKNMRKLPPATVTEIANMSKPGFCQASGSSPPTVDQVADRIFAFLFTAALPLTEKQIQRAIGVRKRLFVVALRNLHRKRKIRRLGLGRNQGCFLYFICGSCLLREAKKRNKKGGQS